MSHSDVGIEVHLYFLIEAAFFGGDHNNPVASPGAPKRCGGCIFENSDIFYIVGIDVADIAFVGKVVQDDKWFGDMEV